MLEIRQTNFKRIHELQSQRLALLPFPTNERTIQQTPHEQIIRSVLARKYEYTLGPIA